MPTSDASYERITAAVSDFCEGLEYARLPLYLFSVQFEPTTNSKHVLLFCILSTTCILTYLLHEAETFLRS